ncbi:hypothetical protein EVAR_102305_1 [Eumeta japonica]|uniref:Uncharacterized protein n=1 Tax=Eumeta variegata TaxID=151549 RepID=A0A4C1WFW2_EUMVA|nr:hypothetical protein EVAR_102305_1 [Eumeta japonica]
MASLLFTVTGSLPLPLKQIQEEILEDDSNSVTSCTLAYSVEEAINVVLIIGIHKKDLMLLNLYMLAGGIVTLLILFLYIMVIIKVGATTLLVLLLELLYNCYVLLLVRSEIVNIKEESKKLQLETEKKENVNIGDEEEGETDISNEDKEQNQNNQEGNDGWMKRIFRRWNQKK